MTAGRADLQEAVREIEAVMARYGVVGAVAVGTSQDNYYGVHIPMGAPVELRGAEDVVIHPEVAQDIPFIESMVRLASAMNTVDKSVTDLMQHLVLRLTPPRARAMRQRLENPEAPRD